MNRIFVDFETTTGPVKRMHAVNNIPNDPHDYYGNGARLGEAGVPYARLHDTGGRLGGGCYVDIPNVFPNFDADETDPASYDFAFTDVLLKEILACGIKPFYRLGVTIENNHDIKAYNIYPPKDFAKWARICEHVILHYNEGWADGFYMDIEYWEIWNEADNEPEAADNPCWKGTKQQFFEMYEIASKHLKSKFPHLKIGGYGCCGFYALTGSNFSEAAKSTPRKEYFLEFLDEFLTYERAHGSPMDFFSWHSYADVRRNVIYAHHARKKMDEFGYTDCEIFLDEWNPGYKNRGELRDGADILAMMCALHDTPTDMCMYYDAAERSSYCGLFNPVGHKPFKAYYAFYAFGKLYAIGRACACKTEGEGLYALAACGEGKRGLILVNDTAEPMPLSLNVGGGVVYATDGDREWEAIGPLSEQTILPPYGIYYAEW